MSSVNPGQLRRGQIYVVILLATYALFNLGTKAYVVYAGMLGLRHVIGTLVFLTVLWFVWRGSRIAYWVLLAYVLVGAVIGFKQILYLPWYAATIYIAFYALLVLAQVAPASRAFLAQQRARHGAQPVPENVSSIDSSPLAHPASAERPVQ